MNSRKPPRRYALVDRRELKTGVRRLTLGRVVGTLDVASTGASAPAPRSRAS